jgi:flavin-dependent dehydrogenase
VLLVDRYEIGERATSACAAPAPWLHALGLTDSIRQELGAMTFSTPHGSVRYELPWRWAAFDYRHLCELLHAQNDARFETATVTGRTGMTVHTDRGDVSAPVIVDALGWRRVLDDAGGYQPPDAPLSRGLEVHPDFAGGDALDVWIERDLVQRGYGWRVPAGDHARIGVGSYEPRHHVKEPTRALATRLDADAVRWQGNWFPHRLRGAAAGGVFFVGDSAGHCVPLSGEGIRTAFHFGAAAGREIASGRPDALSRYAAFSASHARFYGFALALQRAIPRIPPRALTLGLRALRGQSERMFSWYLRQVPVPAEAAARPRARRAPSRAA